MVITIRCKNGRAQKTVQYGFNLQEAVDNQRHTVETDWVTIEKDMYACGFLPGNYPMPATFGQVLITSRNVYRANPQGWDSETYL